MLDSNCLLMQTTSLFDSSSFDTFPPFENVRSSGEVVAMTQPWPLVLFRGQPPKKESRPLRGLKLEDQV